MDVQRILAISFLVSIVGGGLMSYGVFCLWKQYGSKAWGWFDLFTGFTILAIAFVYVFASHLQLNLSAYGSGSQGLLIGIFAPLVALMTLAGTTYNSSYHGKLLAILSALGALMLAVGAGYMAW